MLATLFHECCKKMQHCFTMPTTLNVDWSLLQTMYTKGLTLPEIAEKTGVSYPAIRTRAWRCGWKSKASEANAALQQSVTRTMQERGMVWGSRVANLLEKHLAFLESLPEDRVTLDQLERTTKILERIDNLGRRTLGLDEAQASTMKSVTGPVIDVSYPAPARLPESTSPDPTQDKPSV